MSSSTFWKNLQHEFSQRNKISVGGNMSSMTDLVFLLLIFFIILSTLVSNGKRGVAQGKRHDFCHQQDDVEHQAGRIVPPQWRPRCIRGPRVPAARAIGRLGRSGPLPPSGRIRAHGKTVEVIGMAKANEWKVMLGARQRTDTACKPSLRNDVAKARKRTV